MTPWALILLLFNVIAACPVIAAGMSAKASCCPHSSHPQIPCTERTGRNCPYVLLEKGKAERTFSVAGFDGVTTPTIAELHPPDRLSLLIRPEHLADSSGSYLLLRVLRL